MQSRRRTQMLHSNLKKMITLFSINLITSINIYGKCISTPIYKENKYNNCIVVDEEKTVNYDTSLTLQACLNYCKNINEVMQNVISSQENTTKILATLNSNYKLKCSTSIG